MTDVPNSGPGDDATARIDPKPIARPVIFGIVPVGSLEGAKSRLGAVLDAEERLELTVDLARATIAAAVATASLADVLVVTPDDAVRALALELGARPILQRDSGLNRGIAAARDEAIAAGADAILILPIDLPAVSAAAIDSVARPAADGDRPLVVIVRDRHGRGTNALLLAPPDAIDACFGGDSALAHVAAAVAAGARLVELGGPLALDLDTADDLLLAEPDLQALHRRLGHDGADLVTADGA
jgi:2-phospho-L-lactate/phosphoenolpyruvate guanylyltransferase